MVKIITYFLTEYFHCYVSSEVLDDEPQGSAFTHTETP